MRLRSSFAMTIAILGLPAMADAQSTLSGAKAKIEAQGDAAAARLKEAIAAQEADNGKTAPSAPRPPDPAMRRRAFEAMKSRVTAPQMDARARAALETGRAELDRERDAMAKRLGEALGLDAPDMQALAKGAMPSAKPGWVPVLFVSSSMPVAVLRTYAAQFEKARGVMAFRGMPGGLTKVAPMAKLSAQILRLDPGCEGPACAMRNVQLIVDPIVFRQHGVTRVPALAMIPGDPTLPYCEREEDSPRGAHIVYGDAALSGLLEEYGRLGGREEVRDAQARLDAR